MSQLRFSNVLTLSCLSACLLPIYAYANDVAVIEPKLVGEIEHTIPVLDSQKALDELAQKQAIDKSAKDAQAVVAEGSVSSNPNVITPDSTVEEIYALLEQNPEAFERLLQHSLHDNDVEVIRTLLPAYERYPNRDESVVDWGNAMIALADGDTKKAVQLYRKLNAMLPDVRLIRVQMAAALYQNRQVKASKNELEKLLREDLPEAQRATLTRYLERIKRNDKWNFNVSASFIKDDNLEDAPAVGTTLGNQYGSLSYTTPHEKGTGVNYSLGADKKWSYDNNFFTSFSADVSGNYYWDNKKFNDVYTSASVGVGYQTADSEIELAPTFGKSWYGGGTRAEDDESLKSYTTSHGVRLSAHTWATPNLMLRHSTQFTDLKYEEPYQSNDGEIYSMMNGVFYAPNARRSYGVYWNLSKKDGVRESDSYERSGINVSWNNAWKYGISTSARMGIASKKYDAPNFANITRHNHEYTAGLSIWKRDWSILGLTPRLNINTKKVTSNYAFDETSETNANILFTKTF